RAPASRQTTCERRSARDWTRVSPCRRALYSNILAGQRARALGLILAAFPAPIVDRLLDECIEDFAGYRFRWPVVDRAQTLRIEFGLAGSRQQAVGFLLGVGELRIAKSGKRGGIEQRPDQLLIFGEEGIRIVELAIAEEFLILVRTQVQSSEFTDHDRFGAKLAALGGQRTVVWTNVTERSSDCIAVGVTLAQRLAARRIIVNSEDVADRVLPAVIGDHWPSAIERPGQVIKGPHEI